MSLLVAIFLFGCFIISMVAMGLLFAASTLEAGSRPLFEGQALTQEETTELDKAPPAESDYRQSPPIL
jgi:hypothetical protein